MKTRGLIISLLCATLVACGIPDLKPFSDATAAMATTLRQGFEEARASLGAAAESSPDEAFTTHLGELDERWKPTRKALSSLVGYSDSLAAVAEAGRNGKETMAKVTGALSELAASVGATIPGGGAKIVEAVGAKIIEMQAGNDIRKAVAAASDAVDIMAPVLEQNFADLRRIHNAAAAAWESRVLERWSFQRNYHDALTAEQRRLEYLLTLIIEYQSAPARLRWRAALARAEGNEELSKKLLASIPQEQADQLSALQAADTTFAGIDLDGEDTPDVIEARQQFLLGLINKQRAELSALDPSYRESTTELEAVREARARGDQLLHKAGEAIAAWQKAHRSLQAAAEGQQSRPSVADLLSIIAEISSLIG